MWVLPKLTGSHPWPLWSQVQSTDWILMVKNNAGLLVDKPYRIILKTGKTEGYLVAVGNQEEIMKAWKFIQDNIAGSLNGILNRTDTMEYALGKFRSLALDEELKTLPAEAMASPPARPNTLINIDMDGDEFDARFYFESGDITVVENDLEDLAREDSFFATNQTSSLNLATPQSTLPKRLDLPDSETVLGEFSCSLWTTGAIPRFGKIFVTPNFVAFHSSSVLVFSAYTFVIRLTEIVHVQYFVQSGFEGVQILMKKETAASSTEDGLSGFRTIAFAAISVGTQIYDFVHHQWKVAMKKYQVSASDQKRVREGEKKEEYLVTYEEAMKQKALAAPSAAGPSSSKKTKESTATMAKKGLEQLKARVLKKFRIPDSEVVLTQARTSVTVYAKRGNAFIKSSNDLVTVEGIMYLTPHFLLFFDLFLYMTSPLGQNSQDNIKNNTLSTIHGEKSQKDDKASSQGSLNDDEQSAAVMEAEWDVAAAEGDDLASSSGGLDSAQQKANKQLLEKERRNLPATSLGTREVAPSRLWFIIPLREVQKMRIGKAATNVSTAYADFGIVPTIVNLHLPYNMYSFTFINRPHIYECLNKAYARVVRQEARRVPLPTYSVDSVGSQPSSPPVALSSSPPRSPGPMHDTMDPPPRSVFFQHVTQHPLCSGDAKFPDSILNDSQQFATTYRARERLQEEKFLNYFHKYGQSSAFARKGPELPLLVRNGIPHSLRGHLWFTLSGASARMFTAPKDYFQTLLKTHGGKHSVAVEQIERDLHRSMPSHPFYSSKANPTSTPALTSTHSTDPSTAASAATTSTLKAAPVLFHHPLDPPSTEPLGVSRLRRVLVAYSWHNPVIAYCQSMNIVVAALLLYMSEEEAFYTLITLVEYLEEYWTREMLGAIVDMHVLKDVLKQKKPELVAHLESLQLDYSIVALPWFMCLFIGYVPLQLALRLMDCFFYNAGLGRATSTLFQAAIALFSIAEQELMTCFDPISVSDVLRKSPYGYDCDKLLALVFSDDSLSIRASIIDELRNFHRYNAIQLIEEQNMEEDFGVLVYGKRKVYTIKQTATTTPSDASAASSSSAASSTSGASSSSSSSSNPPETPALAPPPTTPVHFELRELKRFYIDFKTAILSSEPEKAENGTSSKTEAQNQAHIYNTKSVMSSVTETAFCALIRQHLTWWPSNADRLLPHLFKWMDVSNTQSLSFVEYVQGLEVICFGQPTVVIDLFYHLVILGMSGVPVASTKVNAAESSVATPSSTPGSTIRQGLSMDQFKFAVRFIYFTLLYSKYDTIPNESAPAAVTRRPKLDLKAVTVADGLDDWHLVNADEQFEAQVPNNILTDIFISYSDDKIMALDRFRIAVQNQLVLIPPSSMQGEGL